MDRPVSAAEANRQFSRILRGVRNGDTFLVTSHGTPIARIVPAGHHRDDSAAAKKALMSRLHGQSVQILDRRWSRDELYER